jgi:predicted nucleic acid-binding protein
VDASLVVAWLLPEELSAKAILLRQQLRSTGEEFIAPGHLVAEVGSTLRKAVYQERVPAEYGDESFESFKLFPIELHDSRLLMESAWSWAKSLNAPRLYDMYYIALADREGCDLWTADRRLVRLAGKRFSRARWVGDLETESPGVPDDGQKA